MAHSLIEDIQDGIVFIKSNFETCISTERNVSENDAQTNRNEQQRLEVFLDCKLDEHGSHHNHNEVSCRCIGKTSVGKKLSEILCYKFCKSHNLLSLANGDQCGAFHYRIALVY